MKVLGFLVVVLLFTTEATMKTRFRGIKCTSFNETLSTMKCFLKAYSRTYVTINFIENVKVQFEKPIEIKIKVNKRYGTIYRQVFHQEFEWCSAMDGASNNIVANLLMSLVRKSSSDLFATCPFPPGIREFKNVTLDDTTWPSPLPDGFWRFQFEFGEYWSMQFDIEVVSDIKTNMK